MEEQKQEKQVYINLLDLKKQIACSCPVVPMIGDATEYERGFYAGFRMALSMIQEPVDYVLMEPDRAMIYRS